MPSKAKRVMYAEGQDWVDWKPWPEEIHKRHELGNVFGVEFEDGWIWDRIAGWRSSRCPECGKRLHEYC